MNVIFLDVDGVLNSELWARFVYNRRNNHSKKHNNLLDPQRINKLAKYCKTHDIGLIISSSWRWSTYFETFKSFMNHDELHPIIPYIVGVTPYCESRIRGKEIEACVDCLHNHFDEYSYLFKYRFTIDKYVIVDDDNDMLESQLDKFVQTSFWTGLTNKNYTKINKIFGIGK